MQQIDPHSHFDTSSKYAEIGQFTVWDQIQCMVTFLHLSIDVEFPSPLVSIFYMDQFALWVKFSVVIFLYLDIDVRVLQKVSVQGNWKLQIIFNKFGPHSKFDPSRKCTVNFIHTVNTQRIRSELTFHSESPLCNSYTTWY